DIRVLAFATRRPIGALGPEVVFAVLTRTATVLVLIAPRILGYGLLEIGAVPVVDVRIPLERVEALARVGIRADVETILVERRAEQLDLRARGRLLRPAPPPDQPRPHG